MSLPNIRKAFFLRNHETGKRHYYCGHFKSIFGLILACRTFKRPVSILMQVFFMHNHCNCRMFNNLNIRILCKKRSEWIL